VSERTVADWLSRIDKDAKEARNNRIFDLWMACHTQEEIAERENVAKGPVSEICSEFADLQKTNKSSKATSEHATDFNPPVYNISLCHCLSMCQPECMCNLYSHTTNVEAVRRLFAVDRVDSSAGNLPAQPAIFPAYDAPVIRQVDCERELSMMHWGFILPQRDKAPKVVNNTRDDKARTSRFWQSSFEERRCLIPANSFAEYHPKNRDENGHKTVVWFAMVGNEPRPPFAFAGIWRTWKGNYKGELRDLSVYSMMTTTPNEVVKPIHPSRMPVILDAADYDTWLTGSPDEAAGLLRPFAVERMHIATEGGKSDDMRQVAQRSER